MAKRSISRMMIGGRNTGRNTGEAATSPAAGDVEARVIALAEQLGRVVGTVQAKASGWRDRDALTRQITEVRDTATHLLEQLGVASSSSGSGATTERNRPGSMNARESGSNGRQTSAGGRSGGGVEGPGTKHREPTPDQTRATAADADRIATMKTVNAARRRGR